MHLLTSDPSGAGKLRGSVLCLEQQFKQRDKQFRREMDLLRSSNHKEMIFEVQCMC